MKINGKKIETHLNKANMTREKLASNVQDKGFKFSYRQLDRLLRENIVPSKNGPEIMKVIATELNCSVADFSEVQKNTAA